MIQLRLLPVFILIILAAFSLRLADVFVGFGHLQNNAYAASEEKEAKENDEHADEDHGDMKDETADAGDDHDEASPAKPKSDDEEKKARSKWRDATDEDFAYKSVKLDRMEDLEKRRKDLDAKAQKLMQQEALLKAAQLEMDRKYSELSQIRKQIETLLEEQQQTENDQVQSLVEIYEGMKAKEAAAIFNTLDMDILLQVVNAMSERKASPILAKMNPERAKSLTVLLIEQKKLPSFPKQ